MYSVWIDDVCILSCKHLAYAKCYATNLLAFYDKANIFIMPA